MSTYANRGMILEEIIELSNKHYLKTGQALIQKVPTPVKVLKCKGSKIEGFWEKKSTVDFVGVANGKSICFDAKETKGKSLPLQNIHEHQLKFMRDWRGQGGEAFLIVYFKDIDKIFKTNIDDIMGFVIMENRKSIPLSYFEEYAKELKIKIPLEFL